MSCFVDRPRHEALIAELRGIGCGIMLIPDGDVAGVIATTNPDTTVDIYMGSGGAPEGVLAAAALAPTRRSGAGATASGARRPIAGRRFASTRATEPPFSSDAAATRRRDCAPCHRRRPFSGIG